MPAAPPPPDLSPTSPPSPTSDQGRTVDPALTVDELAGIQRLTLALVGLALRSLDAVKGDVTLPQLRLLLVLGDAGVAPSSRVAAALGISPSAVSHAADRLAAAGHLRRVDDPANRRIVALELTGSGRALVDSVLAWRRAELSQILDRLDPAERSTVLTGVLRLADALTAEPTPQPAPAGDRTGPGTTTPAKETTPARERSGR